MRTTPNLVGVAENLDFTANSPPNFFQETAALGQASVNENSPLLTRRQLESLTVPPAVSGVLGDVDGERSAWKIAKLEALILSKYALPLMLAFVLQMSLSITNVWFVGKLGPQALAANALANMFAMLTGMALVFGFATAIDTLASNGFTGARDPYYLGIVLQRAITVMTSFIMPIVVTTWFWSEQILASLGQDPVLARMAGEYLRIFIFGMPFVILFICVRKLLQAQGLMMATFYSALATACFNVFANFFFLVHLELGFRGAAISNACTQVFAAASTLFAMWMSGGAVVWGGFDISRALTAKGAAQFAKIGVPGAATIAQDWALEICALSAGLLGQSALAAQSIVMQANFILAMVNISLGIATGVRVGNHLGSGPAWARRARITGILGIIAGTAIAIMNSIIIIAVRRAWGSLFTKDAEILAIIEQLLPVAAIAQVALGVGSIAASILGACALQRYTATINLSTAYFIGLPLGILLAFPANSPILGIEQVGSGYGLGIVGIWIGMAIANAIALFCKFVVLFRLNWPCEATKAQQRVILRRTGTV